VCLSPSGLDSNQMRVLIFSFLNKLVVLPLGVQTINISKKMYKFTSGVREFYEIIMDDFIESIN
jgi:maltodextrin utilization protein YvdJ